MICCYNSAARLPETLRHIAWQRTADSTPWEVIVVNNASTDDTAAVARRVWGEEGSGAPFTVVDEPEPGLSHARHRGFMTARYEYVLFCDDDNWLAAHYVQVAYEVMTAGPRIGVLGGNGEGVCEVPPPAWYHTYGPLTFAIGAPMEKSGRVPDAIGAVYGAGAVYRKLPYLCLVQHGFRSRLSDRKGNELTSGGDTELCYTYRLMGYQIWYDERLIFKHFIPKERLNWKYLKRFYAGSLKTINILSPYADVLSGKVSSLAQFKKFSSLAKVIDFMREDARAYIVKRTKGYLRRSGGVSGLDNLFFFYYRNRALQWLKYWEYDQNMKRILALKERLGVPGTQEGHGHCQ